MFGALYYVEVIQLYTGCNYCILQDKLFCSTKYFVKNLPGEENAIISIWKLKFITRI